MWCTVWCTVLVECGMLYGVQCWLRVACYVVYSVVYSVG